MHRPFPVTALRFAIRSGPQYSNITETKTIRKGNDIMNEQWKNKKVAFLGDSITAPSEAVARNYWDYLAEECGLVPLVYAFSGWSWAGVRTHAEKLLAEHGEDVDAIFIMMGTNDFNGGVPLGEWFDLSEEETNIHGVVKKKIRRRFNTSGSTLRGRINNGLGFLKAHFPKQQIILLTPIHRGYACFSETNVQPEESVPNEIERYAGEYVECIKEAGNLWAVPVIDLNADSGLFPMLDGYAQYFHLADTDRLHPNAEGHRRIAEVIRYRIQMYPATFR